MRLQKQVATHPIMTLESDFNISCMAMQLGFWFNIIDALAECAMDKQLVIFQYVRSSVYCCSPSSSLGEEWGAFACRRKVYQRLMGSHCFAKLPSCPSWALIWYPWYTDTAARVASPVYVIDLLGMDATGCLYGWKTRLSACRPTCSLISVIPERGARILFVYEFWVEDSLSLRMRGLHSLIKTLAFFFFWPRRKEYWCSARNFKPVSDETQEAEEIPDSTSR